jgi:hypothetical protein
MPVLVRIEALLTRLGAELPPRLVDRVNAALNFVNAGHWMRQRGYAPPRVDTRHQVFDILIGLAGDEKLLYLEFGVWEGASIRYFAERLTHPAAKLHGFDSFQGLPETFIPRIEKGEFDTGGQLPAVEDPRVEFFAGWFAETLPVYEWPAGYERLVVMVDCDLYSSTVEVLSFAEAQLAPGSFVYFDEFNQVGHELRAFDEFLERTGIRFRPVVATAELRAVLFERI